MAVPEVFKGFSSKSPETWKDLALKEFKPRKFLKEDVLIKIEYCGVCGTDYHTIAGNWGPYYGDHTVVGHEAVGTVLQIGEDVKSIKVGDTVGVGAGSGSCGECINCKSGNENYCPKLIQTYNSIHYGADNYITQGGYSSHMIVSEQFVFPVPETLPKELAGPLMCAGLTVFSPMYKVFGEDATGKTVGIIGIGGLGHLAIQFAKALGAKVVAFSRSSRKKEDALMFGADEFVATGEQKNWNQKYIETREFDLILNCASSFTDISYTDYFMTLKILGNFVTVGAPNVAEKMDFPTFPLIFSGISLAGSVIGSKNEAIKMLQLAADKKVYPTIIKLPINEANVKLALENIETSDVRYRYVLTDFDKCFD